MPLTIGLTGGIASGKSLVQDAFAALGVPVLDADQVARDVVAPGTPGLAAIAARFGAEVLLSSGELDRRKLRERVFADAGARRDLEAITHPLIRERMQGWLRAQTTPYCILSVPLLVGGPTAQLVDRVLVVDVPVETQHARLMRRDAVDATLAQQMIAAQADRETRLASADDVLENTGSVASAQAAVAELHRHYLELVRLNQPRAPGLRLPLPANSVTIKI